MRTSFIVASLLVAAVLAVAAEPLTVDQLKQRAAAAKVSDQPGLFMEIAEWQLKAADNAYNQGKTEQGKAAVDDVAAYCEKAGTAARTSKKHLKHTEIKVRDLSRKLEAMRRTLSFEDREPLQAAIDRLEKVRNELLTAMFGPRS